MTNRATSTVSTMGNRILNGVIYTEEQMRRARRGSHSWLAAGSQGKPVPDDMPATFSYAKWRYGGWYVQNVLYPSGACGCVSNNYTDGKWRVVEDSHHYDFRDQKTYPSREAAARAEFMRARS